MRNYIQPGNSLSITAPAGGVMGGDFVIVGSLFGIAAYDAAEGENAEIVTTGVFELPKAGTAAIAQGAKVYHIAASGLVTATAGSNLFIGHATEGAPEAATSVRVRLSL